jgi:uncharacterized membrane protein YhaH (DUF805 family)
MGDTLSYPQYTQQPTQPQALQSGEPPIWAPYYGAPFAAAVKRVFKKYSTFSGRASRSEYWWFALVSTVVSFVLNILIMLGTTSTGSSYSSSPSMGPIAMIGSGLLVVFAVAVFIPSLALMVRRLHDGNFSGWLLLVALVPFLGALALLIFTILPSNPAGQRFDKPGTL